MKVSIIHLDQGKYRLVTPPVNSPDAVELDLPDDEAYAYFYQQAIAEDLSQRLAVLFVRARGDEGVR